MNRFDPAGVPDWAALADSAWGGGLLAEGVGLAQAASVLRGSLVYLATPYSREVVEDGRFVPYLSDKMGDEAALWSRRLALQGVTAVSPIVAAVAMLGWGGIDPLDQVFWTNWCRPLLQGCDAVVIPPIPGWDRSQGVWVEALVALRSNRRVLLLQPMAVGVGA